VRPTGSKTLLVNEIFGPTWQGEGPQRGQLSAFVRLGTCNLACSWCDTPYAVFYDKRKADKHWSKKVYDPKVELLRMTPAEIVDRVESIVPFNSLVIFSGGEPAIQQEGIADVIRIFVQRMWNRFAIETAGTLPLRDLILSMRLSTHLHVTVSPKLNNSGNDKEDRYKPAILKGLSYTGATFKFVVESVSDYKEVHTIIKECDITPGQVWIMPEGTHWDDLLDRAENIAPYALRQGWNFTLRDQILIFGDKRGT